MLFRSRKDVSSVHVALGVRYVVENKWLRLFFVGGDTILLVLRPFVVLKWIVAASIMWEIRLLHPHRTSDGK